VKVVLTGEGSDEIFGAYSVFVTDKFRRILTAVNSMWTRRIVYNVVCRLRKHSPDSIDYLLKAHLALRAWFTSATALYRLVLSMENARRIRPHIYSPAMREELASVDVEEELVTMNKEPMHGLHPHNASIWFEPNASSELGSDHRRPDVHGPRGSRHASQS